MKPNIKTKGILKSKKIQTRQWYNFSWLLLPILVLALAIGLIFYYYIFPYSSRFNKNFGRKNTAVNSTKVDNSARKLSIKSLTAAPVAGDENSNGADLQISLVNERLEPQNADGDIIVTLSSSTQSGNFVGGERQQIDSGTASVKVRYTDTHAGPVSLTAFVSDMKAVSLDLEFKPAAAAGISKILIGAAESSTVKVNTESSYSASVVDRFGNVISGQSINWSIPSQGYQTTVKQNAAGRSIFNFVFSGNASRSEIIRAASSAFSQDLSVSVEP